MNKNNELLINMINSLEWSRPKRRTYNGKESDITVSHKNGKLKTITFRNNTWDFFGEKVSIAELNGVLYLRPDINGYKISSSSRSKNKYINLNTEYYPFIKKYAGDYELKAVNDVDNIYFLSYLKND